jgi:hypothetical protein
VAALPVRQVAKMAQLHRRWADNSNDSKDGLSSYRRDVTQRRGERA